MVVNTRGQASYGGEAPGPKGKGRNRNDQLLDPILEGDEGDDDEEEAKEAVDEKNGIFNLSRKFRWWEN